MKAEHVRKDKARSYRFTQDDLDLIERLREQFADPAGEPCSETAVLRAGIRALAKQCGLEKKSGKKS